MADAHIDQLPEVNPYGDFNVRPTKNGIEIQVTVRDDARSGLIAGVMGVCTLAVVWLVASDVFTAIGAAIILLAANIATFRLLGAEAIALVEVRADGLVVDSPLTGRPLFYARRAIQERMATFEDGLLLRYGIYDCKVLPPFVNVNEFELFDKSLEKLIAALWHQQNVNM